MNTTQNSADAFPRTLYVLLWFPVASETFVFYEIEKFFKQKRPVSVITLYGERHKNLAGFMLNTDVPIEHFGMLATGRILAAFWRRLRKEPKKALYVMRTLLFRRWRSVEMWLEGAWAGISGFYLAERCQEMGIKHLHAPWANGPATASWVVNYLDGIPFSFTARARDVRPPDGFLEEKLDACAFARSESSYQIPLMASFLPTEKHDKLYVTYNVRTLAATGQAAVSMQEPYKLLAIGRLVEKKGYDVLIESVSILVNAGVNVKLNIIGSGDWMSKLNKCIATYGMEEHVNMLGFVEHDGILKYILDSDVFCMPSVVNKQADSDGLPNVVIEAMCYGLPVVATDVAGMSDVVKDNETGYLVPQRDAKAFANALQKMFDDPNHARLMATKGKELMDVMFDNETNLERIRQLFNKYTP